MAEQFIDDNLDPIVPIPKENIILLDSGQPVNNTGTGTVSYTHLTLPTKRIV